MSHTEENGTASDVDSVPGMPKINLAVIAVSSVILGLIFAGFAATKTDVERTSHHAMTAAEASSAVASLAAQYWNYRLSTTPELGTYFVDGAPPQVLSNISAEAAAVTAVQNTAFLQQLQAVDNTVLGEEDQITLAMLITSVQNAIEAWQFKEYFLVMNQLQGPQLDLPNFPKYMDLSNSSAVGLYLNWLSLLPAHLDQYSDLLRAAVTQNVVYPTIILGAVAGQIDNLCTPSATSVSPFLSPIASRASAAQLQQAQQSIALISAAYCRLGNVWTNVYMPATSSAIAASTRISPTYYTFVIQRETTLELSVQDLHQIGLNEVNRILGEMSAAQASMPVGYNMSLSDLNNYMRSDPQFTFPTESAYLSATRDICKRADALLPSLFNWLPRCPYGVTPMDPASGASGPAAYYMQPDLDCSRAGMYVVNTYNLPARPSYTMESTALHETVPGHHLQLALAQELTALPEFRRVSEITAYVEGWALYAESLGANLGMYTDPYNLYGHLADDMLRACRLVVDTGMHALSWTQEQSINYMATNTPLSMQDITSEVNRYIAWPGQALAYKAGALTIQKLRDAAAAALGSNFDIKAFHTAVLQHGAVPLPVLVEAVTTDLGFTAEISLTA